MNLFVKQKENKHMDTNGVRDWETGTGIYVLVHGGTQSLSRVRLLTLRTHGL